MSYRVEYASSARAGCKSGKTHGCMGQKIEKGSLRFGTYVTMNIGGGDGKGSFQWRHWGCVSDKVLANMKTKLLDGESDDKPVDDLLDGFDELKDEDKEKIRKAWEVGHGPFPLTL
ncbi:zf-PARP-domain-containing protein [Atractiella rhizophila]|nr:zf-PARP-domain-containing protein [Atractiella rhizophila]